MRQKKIAKFVGATSISNTAKKKYYKICGEILKYCSIYFFLTHLFIIYFLSHTKSCLKFLEKHISNFTCKSTITLRSSQTSAIDFILKSFQPFSNIFNIFLMYKPWVFSTFLTRNMSHFSSIGRGLIIWQGTVIFPN